MPPGWMATNVGFVPVDSVGVVSGVSAPVLRLMRYPESWLEFVSATYKKFPEGSTANDSGAKPAENGEPVTATRLPSGGDGQPGRPVAQISNALTLLDPSLATYKYMPLGSIARPAGEDPAAKGDPGTVVRTPEVEFTAKPETEFSPELETYRKAPEGVIANPLGTEEPGTLGTVLNGEPGTVVKVAFEAIEKTETLSDPWTLTDPWLATKTKCPPWSMVRATGFTPVAVLLPAEESVPLLLTE